MRHILLAALLLMVPSNATHSDDGRPLEVVDELAIAARCEAASQAVITLTEAGMILALMLDLRTATERESVEKVADMLKGASDEVRSWHAAILARRAALTEEAISLRIRHTDAEVNARRDHVLAGHWRGILATMGNSERMEAAIAGIGLEAEECDEWAR